MMPSLSESFGRFPAKTNKMASLLFPQKNYFPQGQGPKESASPRRRLALSMPPSSTTKFLTIGYRPFWKITSLITESQSSESQLK